VATIESGLVASPAERRPGSAETLAEELARTGAPATPPVPAPPAFAPGDLDATTVMPALGNVGAPADQTRVMAPAEPPPRRPEPAQPAPVERREGSGMGPLLAVLLVGAIGFALWVALKKPMGNIETPSLLDKSQAQAEQMLKELELKPTLAGSSYNDQVPDGRVQDQEPDPGARLKAGDEVKFWLSKGSRFVAVPSVIGRREGDAKRELREAGFTFGGTEFVAQPDAPDGVVVAQYPKAGIQGEREDPVRLFVNRRPKEPPKAAPEPEPTAEPQPDAEAGKEPDGAAQEPVTEGAKEPDILDRAVNELKKEAGKAIEKTAQDMKERAAEAAREKAKELKDRIREGIGGGKDEKGQ
jgi:hypothetical protein